MKTILNIAVWNFVRIVIDLELLKTARISKKNTECNQYLNPIATIDHAKSPKIFEFSLCSLAACMTGSCFYIWQI